MWIKVLLLIAVAIVAVVALRAPRGARHVAMRRIALLAFVAFAAASILFPDVWNTLANAVGVGRGTDLLLYVTIVVFLGYMASSYLRFRGMESQITLLARRIALDEAGAGPVVDGKLVVEGDELAVDEPVEQTQGNETAPTVP